MHIIVEDSTDGFVLCEVIRSIYADRPDVILESFHGVVNFKNSLEETIKNTPVSETIVAVYDDIMENPIVRKGCKDASELAKQYKSRAIRFIGTMSFELETLMVDGIEYFADFVTYRKYVWKIRELYNKGNCRIAALTEYTKENEIYDRFYDKIRKEKRKKKIYKGMSDEVFESCVTVESLAKELLKEIFREHVIDRPMTKCWIDSCCYRKNMCEKYLIDINKIIDAQNSHNDPYVKANMIIGNTSYAELAQSMNGGNNVISYDICDFLDDEAMLTINKDIVLEGDAEEGEAVK